MSITGLEQLEALERQLERMADAPERAAARAAPELLQVARAQWAAGTGPDGEAWPRNRDGSVPLQGLAEQAKAHAEGAAVVLELPDEARPHQAGTARLPRRPMMPDEGAALPEAWERVLVEALQKELEG